MGRFSMPHIILLALATVILAVAPALGAERTIKWDDDTCTHSTRFDPKKVDATRLRSTVNFLFLREDIVLPPAAFAPQDLPNLDIGRYQAQCEKAIRDVTELKLIDLPGMEDYRQIRLEQHRDVCAYGTALIRGLRESPAHLRQYTPAAASCSSFVDALEGKTDLDTEWRALVRANCRNNASPQACERRHFDEGARPDGDLWKRIYVAGYAWSNCAVSGKAMQDALQKRFRQQFRTRKLKCDEP
jgi:hypothetical protein